MFNADREKIKGAEVQSAFIMRLYDGFNMAETCADLRLNPGAVAIVMQDDIEFNNAVRQAQAFRVDLMTDKLENIEDYQDNPHMAKVVSDNIKWLASKRYKEIYGDKLEVNHNHTINIKDAMIEAQSRTLNFIEHKPLKTLDTVTDNVSVEVIEHAADIDPLS